MTNTFPLPFLQISAVKGKIESQHGHQAASQKIIFSGKILTDSDTVQSCGVTEKDFLVLMVSKPKAAKPAPSSTAATTASDTPAPAAGTTTSASATDASTTSTAAAPQAPATSTAPAEAASVPAAAPTESGPPGSSQFLTGSALEQAVNNIVEMGFEKSEVQKAMRASFNNPERAVEYLMTGIPEHLSQPQAPPAAPAAGAGAGAGAGAAQQGAPTSPATSAQPAAQPAATAAPRTGNLFEAAAAQAQGGGGRAAGGGRGGDSLAALRDLGEDDGSGNTALDLGNPAMIGQLRQLVQQNPAALAPLVQALAQSNPQLANAMADDPEAVLNLLANNAGGGDEGDEGVALPSMNDLGPEDRTAVEQIIAMGIEESKAIEVYLMCGRNVEMAIQYYFDNPQDFED